MIALMADQEDQCAASHYLFTPPISKDSFVKDIPGASIRDQADDWLTLGLFAIRVIFEQSKHWSK